MSYESVQILAFICVKELTPKSHFIDSLKFAKYTNGIRGGWSMHPLVTFTLLVWELRARTTPFMESSGTYYLGLYNVIAIYPECNLY